MFYQKSQLLLNDATLDRDGAWPFSSDTVLCHLIPSLTLWGPQGSCSDSHVCRGEAEVQKWLNGFTEIMR